MTMPTPPQLDAAFSQVSAALDQVEGRKIDLLKEPWEGVEKAAIKLLGGPFNPQKMEHQVVALGLASAFARRLHADHQAFWFPSREAIEGASLGFPEALIMLSPFGAVVDALAQAKLNRLDDVQKDIRSSLAQVKFGGAGAGQRIGPEDYMRLFDPGFVQVVALDPVKAGQTWTTPPERLSIDVRDAIGRAQKLPPELKKQMETQLLTALQRMEPGKPLINQVQRAPRVCEVIGLLFGTATTTGSAPEEFWMDVVLPLLFIGTPTNFPPLEGEELEAAKQGIDPLLLFLDVVPHQFKSDDEGLLGAFPSTAIGLPHDGFAAVQSLRLVKVSPELIKEPLSKFDEKAVRASIEKFAAAVKAQTGEVKVQGQDEAKQMLDAAMVLLVDLKRVVEAGKDVCVRRLTEAEAASEPALALVRQALSAPRIILAT